MFIYKNIDIRLKYSDSDEKLWTNKKKFLQGINNWVTPNSSSS